MSKRQHAILDTKCREMVESDTVYFDRETSGGPLNWQKEEQVGLYTGEYYLFRECQALKHNMNRKYSALTQED